MSQREGIEALVHALHGARLRADLGALCACFSPAASFRIAGASDGKPISIRARGEAEFRPWLAMMVKAFRLSDYELLALVIDGARASAYWRVRIHSKITGAAVATELVDLLEVEAGRIVAYTEFFTPS
jgi:ketosteroid isomerase-like protein